MSSQTNKNEELHTIINILVAVNILSIISTPGDLQLCP